MQLSRLLLWHTLIGLVRKTEGSLPIRITPGLGAKALQSLQSALCILKRKALAFEIVAPLSMDLKDERSSRYKYLKRYIRTLGSFHDHSVAGGGKGCGED